MKQILTFMGIPITEVCTKMELPYITVWRHARGLNTVSAELAIKYEEKMGIPRYLIRPDLWPRPDQASRQDQEGL